MKEINIYLHHTALAIGYISVKPGSEKVEPYKGRFGEGYKVKKHNPRSTRYCYVEYWIFQEGGKRK